MSTSKTQTATQTAAAATEGVIHFRASHAQTPLESVRFGDLAAEISAWRMILAGLGLIGQDPVRYDGAGYGNVSGRVGPFPGARGRRPFLVSATQTSGLQCLTLDQYVLVESYDINANQVCSRGVALPSSESMTHGAIYDLAPHIRFVLHVHSPLIWPRARALRLPTTHPSIGYGTPEMALEVRRLGRESSLLDTGVFSMGGHEDGVVAFGRSADEAGAALLRIHARAQIMVFENEQRVCVPRQF
jgi:ribulose-5-phosphate 4-epimerase/fuculose-1-phosphate aldolase